MTMNTKFYSYCLTLLLALVLGSCDEMFPSMDDATALLDEAPEEQEDKMVIDRVIFSPDYKTFVATGTIKRDIGPYLLADTARIRVKVEEFFNGIPLLPANSSRLTSIRNVEGEVISSLGLKTMAVVDLSLPQDQINKMKEYVGKIRTSFTTDNLYLTFIFGDTISSTIKASDYVMENYFMHQNSDHKLLLRAIRDKKQEMISRQGPWASAKDMVMMIFSDGKVYAADDLPMDDSHYHLQEELVSDDESDSARLLCYYEDMNTLKDQGSEAANVISKFCDNHHGLYLTSFSWSGIKEHILKTIDEKVIDNEFYFTNPDYKIYRGGSNKVRLTFCDAKTDSVMGTATVNIHLGSIYNPIIVRGRSIFVVLIEGLLLGLLILLLTYTILMFLEPYVRYRLFKRKYVVTYTGPQMSVDGVSVAQRCYLCKAPFVEGDQVVAKCEHTMHKTCWDENDYHCPEYSDRCKHGSHYYNRRNLLDTKNATFYVDWLLMGLVMAIVSWAVFIILSHSMTDFFLNRMNNLLADFDTMAGHENLSTISGIYINQLPSFGLVIGFFLTLGISILAVHQYGLTHRVRNMLLRSVTASLGCYLIFQLVNMFEVAFRLADYSSFLDWIPWTISGFIIAYSATVGTRIRLKKLLLLAFVILGFLSMYVWAVLSLGSQIDFRVLLLFSYMLFSVGLSLCVATQAPRSAHYYLHVSGAIKDMDIALYKWFRTDPHSMVTIGRSTDCSLQLSWDLESQIAPIQAELIYSSSVVCLRVVDGEVYKNNKLLTAGTIVPLYHGSQFTIGRTTFTYIEKDR